jgi:hypothetical protein
MRYGLHTQNISMRFVLLRTGFDAPLVNMSFFFWWGRGWSALAWSKFPCGEGKVYSRSSCFLFHTCFQQTSKSAKSQFMMRLHLTAKPVCQRVWICETSCGWRVESYVGCCLWGRVSLSPSNYIPPRALCHGKAVMISNVPLLSPLTHALCVQCDTHTHIQVINGWTTGQALRAK